MAHTLRNAFLLLGLLLPFSALGSPVTVSVDAWRTPDGNFAYSAIHGATAGAMNRDGALFLAGGAIQYQVDPTGTLLGDLTGDVLDFSGTVLLDGAGSLDLDGALDFGVASGALIGTLDYTLTTSGGSYVETGAWYFYNYDFTNGSCDANGLCNGDTYRLWGNNWDNVLAGQTPSEDNVTVTQDGVTSVETVHRGIDLGGNITPIPEPTAALVFALGLLIIRPLKRR